MPKAKHAKADPDPADGVTVSWGGNAHLVYDTGFMHKLRKTADGGVCLFNMDLVENDSPGAGCSEKGVWSDIVWGKNRARKILHLDDPRADKAWLVFFVCNGWNNPNGLKHPLRFSVNGHTAEVAPWDFTKCHLTYRWTEFPAAWLVKGENVIDLWCPAARSKAEGWELYLARADEFPSGGGDPTPVGRTSFKSADGGKSWHQSPFGPDRQTRAEYTVRLSLDRYVRTGWLASPVLDLWRGDSTDFIVPVRIPRKLTLAIAADTPPGTTVQYFLRSGTSPEPFSPEWGPYEPIGTGASIDVEMGQASRRGRYVQFKAILSSTNPLRTPVVKSAHLTVDLLEAVPAHESIKAVEVRNPTIRYSSVGWEWEPAERPEFEELRGRENLDGVIAGSRTPFEAMVRLCEYATTRTGRKHGTPLPDYPGWDALSIAKRVDQHGNPGMCIQFNNFLAGLCMAYGWQGRLVNGMNHEMAEIWSDDFGKWVYFDASYANHHMVDDTTGEPMSLLELHNAHLDYFYPDRRIDWMNDLTTGPNTLAVIERRNERPGLSRSSPTYHRNMYLPYEGMQLSAFLRLIPRNNFYEKPTPIPLTHGCTWWPWNGYLNWYDERTPPKRQYSWFTDRPADMWPDLNLVHVDATTGHSNRFLFLSFETYTPNFSHFEVDENDTGWKRVESSRWTWVLATGRNTLRVRAVSRRGAKGRPSTFAVNRADVPLKDLYL